MQPHASLSSPAVIGLEALTPANAAASNGIARDEKGSPIRPWRVCVVSPCFNRHKDLELLLADLGKQDLRGIQMWVVVVDNASTQPLSSVNVPEGLAVEFLRLPSNTGGSGGFNAGMARVLSGEGLSAHYPPPDFLWWLDSDARASKRALRELVRVMAKRKDIGALGSGMRDVSTGRIWEIGGKIWKRNGAIGPAATGAIDTRFPSRADYVAACSALVRRDAIERTGLFPDNFIYYDDVDWCVRMRLATGLKSRACVRSRAYHPPADRRFATWTRYYISRNGFSMMTLLNHGKRARMKRVLAEVNRAVAQAIMNLPELSELHLRGLDDALHNRFEKVEPKNLLKPLGFKPFKDLPATLDELRAKHGTNTTLWAHPLLRSRIAGLEDFTAQIRTMNINWPNERYEWRNRALGGHLVKDGLGALRRLITGPSADVAIVPTGWPSAWFRGKTQIQITSEGFLVRESHRARELRSAISVCVRGVKLAIALAMNPPPPRPLEPVPTRSTGAMQEPMPNALPSLKARVDAMANAAPAATATHEPVMAG
jgi:GT2 family glycosyltransferase